MKAWLQYGHIHKTWSWRFYCSTSLVLLICNCVALNKAIQQQLPFYGGLQYLQFEVTRIVPFTSIEIVLYTPFFVLNILLPTENIVHCSDQYIHIRDIWYHIFYLDNQMQLSSFAICFNYQILIFTYLKKSKQSTYGFGWTWKYESVDRRMLGNHALMASY